MFGTILPVKNGNEAIDKYSVIDEGECITLTHDLERLFVAAQPRLERFARMHGVAPDGVEDVVQETLVEAWRHLEYLHTAERFDAWLNGICRNVSLRWMRVQGTLSSRQSTFSSLQGARDNDDRDTFAVDIADPLAPDLAEEVNRQDLAVLLDRAMGYLPATTREALEMHYLADLPQREVAERLGMTINALEVKLHRARRQLRLVHSGELRADAEAFGMTLDNEVTQGWRATSVWCLICGRQRMLGMFEARPDGDFALRLRCPVCSSGHGIDIVNSGSLVSLKDLRSFRPAVKRLLQTVPTFYIQALSTKSQICPTCHNMVRLLGIEPNLLPPPFYGRFGAVFECATCGTMTTSIISTCLAYTAAHQFIMQHAQCIIGPEECIEYEGQPAIRTSLIDIVSTERLTLLLHRHTLQLLASFTGAGR